MRENQKQIQTCAPNCFKHTVQSFHLKKNTGQRNHYYYHEHAKATRGNAGRSEAYKYKTQSDTFLSKRKGSKFL